MGRGRAYGEIPRPVWWGRFQLGVENDVETKCCPSIWETLEQKKKTRYIFYDLYEWRKNNRAGVRKVPCNDAFSRHIEHRWGHNLGIVCMTNMACRVPSWWSWTEFGLSNNMLRASEPSFNCFFFVLPGGMGGGGRGSLWTKSDQDCARFHATNEWSSHSYFNSNPPNVARDRPERIYLYAYDTEMFVSCCTCGVWGEISTIASCTPNMYK